ncbi:proline-rich protein 2-like [Neovison vison]|uniref:proline-rich protein 2-like n=1 Tax=Neovison vison TaxID=452646 RepID=UPI001CF054A0|nr:proline-rich protein 2-like [Neogale vison]
MSLGTRDLHRWKRTVRDGRASGPRQGLSTGLQARDQTRTRPVREDGAPRLPAKGSTGGPGSPLKGDRAVLSSLQADEEPVTGASRSPDCPAVEQEGSRGAPVPEPSAKPESEASGLARSRILPSGGIPPCRRPRSPPPPGLPAARVRRFHPASPPPAFAASTRPPRRPRSPLRRDPASPPPASVPQGTHLQAHVQPAGRRSRLSGVQRPPPRSLRRPGATERSARPATPPRQMYFRYRPGPPRKRSRSGGAV